MTLPVSIHERSALRYIQTHPGQLRYRDIRTNVHASHSHIDAVAAMYPDNCETGGTGGYKWIRWHGYAPYAICERYLAWLPTSSAPQTYYTAHQHKAVAIKVFDLIRPLEKLAGMNPRLVYDVLMPIYLRTTGISKTAVKDICYYCVRFAAYEVEHGRQS